VQKSADGGLWLLLLCLGIGSIVSMPISGAFAAKFGCRRVITIAVVMVAATLPFLATLSALPLLVVTLMVSARALALSMSR
jgi:predicted MFS family arabinose efflux permease